MADPPPWLTRPLRRPVADDPGRVADSAEHVGIDADDADSADADAGAVVGVGSAVDDGGAVGSAELRSPPLHDAPDPSSLAVGVGVVVAAGGDDVVLDLRDVAVDGVVAVAVAVGDDDAVDIDLGLLVGHP